MGRNTQRKWTTDQVAKFRMWSWLWRNSATWINLALSNFNRIDLMSSLNQLFIETPYPKSQLALCTAHFRSYHSICWTQPQLYYLFSFVPFRVYQRARIKSRTRKKVQELRVLTLPPKSFQDTMLLKPLITFIQIGLICTSAMTPVEVSTYPFLQRILMYV